LERIDPARHPFLTLVRERKVIEVIAPAREVGRRSDADLFVEDPDEAPLAEAGPPRALRDLQPLGNALESLQRKSYGRMAPREACCSREEGLLENTEPRLRRGGVEQTIAELRGLGSPQRLERDEVVPQLPGRSEEREGPARLEMHSYRRSLAGSVYT
jgi:hypothetical protein